MKDGLARKKALPELPEMPEYYPLVNHRGEVDEIRLHENPLFRGVDERGFVIGDEPRFRVTVG